MAFIIKLSSDKMETKKQQLGWDMVELVGSAKLNKQECEALLEKKDDWEFKLFGKDAPMTFKELTVIIKGVHKLAHLMGFNYYELIKVNSV